MTLPLVVVAVVGMLLLGAVGGPRLLARLAPALSARPRQAMALWASAAGVWVSSLLSLGPLLAWTLAGERRLPGAAGELCWRCVAAANPFSSASRLVSDLPAYPLLAVPAVVLGAVAVSAGARFAVHRRRLRRQLRRLELLAEARDVQGVRAWIVPSQERLAYALPRRRDGIVVSQGTVDCLGAEELAAVLRHEQAHLRERHHLLLGTLRTLSGVFSWVPLVAAAPAAVADYAEMAADDAARRTCGTRALAGALLALHRPVGPAPAGALHAGRHEPLSRVERLVASEAQVPRVGLTVVGASVLMLAGAAMLVVVPTLWVAVSGC